MNAFSSFVACKRTLQSAAGANISPWHKALCSEGFAQNPNCSLQLLMKANENACEFPCSGIMQRLQMFLEGRASLLRLRLCRQAWALSSGQQTSAFNPWRALRAPFARQLWPVPRGSQGVHRGCPLMGSKHELFGAGRQPAIF